MKNTHFAKKNQHLVMKRVFKMQKGPKDKVILRTTLSCNINNHISILTHILVGTYFSTLGV